MKILVLSSHTPSLFWFRMEMMLAFLKRGASVTAVGNEPESQWENEFKSKGITYRSIPVSRNGLNIISDLRTFNALRKIIQIERPDKIFTYQAKTIVYGILASRYENASVANYPLIAGLGSIFRGTTLKSKILSIILGAQYKLAFRFSSKVIFQNNDDMQELLRRGILDESKAEIINGSGVNLDKFTSQPLPTQKAILFIGRLIRDKGIMEYLELAKRIKRKLPEVRCLLVGPFDTNPSAISKKDLQPLIDSNIIEFFGEQSDVRPYINNCTVYILPSYHEGTPKSVLEAMASSRPVITTDAPGCRSTIKPGLNGYLVPVKDIDSLEHFTTKILNNPDLATTMGAAGRIIAEEKYDVHKVNESIITILDL